MQTSSGSRSGSPTELGRCDDLSGLGTASGQPENLTGPLVGDRRHRSCGAVNSASTQ